MASMILIFVLIYFLSMVAVVVLFVFFNSSAEVDVSSDKGDSSGASVEAMKGKSKLDLLKSVPGNTRIKLSGAIAGFVVLFGVFTYFFLKTGRFMPVEEHDKKMNELKAEMDTVKPLSWTITGSIIKEKSNAFDGIMVNYIPPSPAPPIPQADGSFSLFNVQICKSLGWPKLQFSCPGYWPSNYKINEDNTEIDYKTKVITLKEKIYLNLIPKGE